jgi:hypothetical protein
VRKGGRVTTCRYHCRRYRCAAALCLLGVPCGTPAGTLRTHVKVHVPTSTLLVDRPDSELNGWRDWTNRQIPACLLGFLCEQNARILGTHSLCSCVHGASAALVTTCMFRSCYRLQYFPWWWRGEKYEV